MVPISVVKELMEMHNAHLTKVTEVIGKHLERAAELYERALNPPASQYQTIPQSTGLPGHISEEEAELHWQREAGVIDHDTLQSELKRLGIDVNITA